MSYDEYQAYPPAQPNQYDQNWQYYNQYYSQYPVSQPPQQSLLSGWFDFRNPQFLKGVLLAAGVTMLATNPKVQKSVLTGLAKTWSGLQYGVEEVKEQINDIRAEMQFKQEQKAAAAEADEAADA